MSGPERDSNTAAPGSFAQGTWAVAAAFRYLLFHPSLWPKIIVPILLTFLIFAITIPVLMMVPVWLFDSFDVIGPDPTTQSAGEAAAWYTQAWIGIVRAVGATGQVMLWALWVLTCIALTYLLFSTVGMAIMGPFMDSLTAVVETRLGVAERVDQTLVDGVVQSVRDTTYLVSRNLSWTVLLLPLLLIPFVGALAFFLLGAHFMASEQLEYPMARRGWSRDQRTAWRKANKSAARGVGMAGAALMMIPFINLLVLPVVATAGTLLFCRVEFPHSVASKRIG